MKFIIAKISSLKEEIKPKRLVHMVESSRWLFTNPQTVHFVKFIIKYATKRAIMGELKKNPAPVYLLQNPKTTNLHK